MGALATREAVFKACDHLLMQGQYPSARSVVAITKGSLSTVGPLRDEWWRQIASSYRDTKFLPGIPPEVSDFLTGVWSAACTHAARKFDDQASEMSRDLASAREAHRLASERVADLQSVLGDESRRASMLAERIVELESSLSTLEHRHAADVEAHRLELFSQSQAHSERLADVEAARAEDARAHAAEIGRMEDERRRLLNQVDASRQETIRLSEASLAAASRHEAAMHAASHRLDQATAQNLELTAALMSARAEATSAISQLTSLQAHVAQLAAERDALAARLRDADGRIESQAKLISDQIEASRAIGESLAGFQALLANSPQTIPAQTRPARKR